MLFSEIKNTLLVLSGQYITGDLEGIGLSLNNLYQGLLPEIENYERYFPLKKKFNVTVQTVGNFSANLYDFTNDPNNAGFNPESPSSTGDVDKDLIVTSTQTITLTIPTKTFADQYGYPVKAQVNSTSVEVLLDSVVIGQDDGIGVMVFTDPSTYTGTINYITGVVTIQIANYPTAETKTFQAHGQYVEKGHTPEFVSKVVPVGFRQTMNNWWQYKRSGGYPGQLGRVPVPRMSRSEYRKPILYDTEPGRMDLECHYVRWKHPILDDNNVVVDYDILELDRTKILIDLLLARFFLIVGASRSAYIHTDMPITTSAEEMVRMGEKQYEEALKLMYSNQNWWDAFKL